MIPSETLLKTTSHHQRMNKSYSELITLPTFEERYEYLKLDGSVGEATFGYDRWINQIFYKSKEWKQVRDEIIIRDNGCDLAMEGYEIFNRHGITIHHINPISLADIKRKNLDVLLDPENLVCTTHATHNAIHYGDASQLRGLPVTRYKNDTCPWRH